MAFVLFCSNQSVTNGSSNLIDHFLTGMEATAAVVKRSGFHANLRVVSVVSHFQSTCTVLSTSSTISLLLFYMFMWSLH